MIKVSVLYPEVQGGRFDIEYYTGQHMPLVRRLLGAVLLRYEVEEGVSGGAPGSLPVYRAGVHMYFESAEGFNAAFGPHAKVIRQDVGNFTDLVPVMQVSRVVE